MEEVNHRYVCECGLDVDDHPSNLSSEEWINVFTLHKLNGNRTYRIINPGHTIARDVVVEKHEKYWIVK